MVRVTGKMLARGLDQRFRRPQCLHPHIQGAQLRGGQAVFVEFRAQPPARHELPQGRAGVGVGHAQFRLGLEPGQRQAQRGAPFGRVPDHPERLAVVLLCEQAVRERHRHVVRRGAERERAAQRALGGRRGACGEFGPGEGDAQLRVLGCPADRVGERGDRVRRAGSVAAGCRCRVGLPCAGPGQ
jgi:hypothetical protein